MKEKDNNTIKTEFRRKFAEHNMLYSKTCDDIRSLIKDFVTTMCGGFYMFETYQPYVIIEVYDGRRCFYDEASAYAICVKNNDVYIYISTPGNTDITKEDMLSEDVEESEDWYLFDWDSGFVFEQAISSVIVEMMDQ